jgi:hypothetical protein
MKNPSLRFFVPILLGAALAAAPLTLTDEAENYRQLQAMPRERRVALLKNLDLFDKLDSSEQTKIRKLNAEIATKDPVNQTSYRLLMRRYQLWVSSLSKEQQEALRAADDPDARIKLAVEYRKKELQAVSSAHRIHGVRSGYYGLKAPSDAAFLLRIWQKMNAAQKVMAEKQDGQGKLEHEIRETNRRLLLIKPNSFHEEDLAPYKSRIDADDDFKRHIGILKPKGESEKTKKPDQAATKAEEQRVRTEQVFAQFLYFEDPAHKPRPVSQQNLEKFSAFCPDWFHSMLDPLSADDARNYLTIVYRQIFPDLLEINSNDWKPAKEKVTVAPGSPRPSAPKRSTSQVPL